MPATGFGASSGYVSISIVPFTVSSTITGPAPGDFAWAPASALMATTTASVLSRFDKFAYFRHPDLRAHVREDALRTQRIHRAADVLAPGHEIQVDDRPPPARRRFVERVLGLVGRFRPHPAHAVRDPVDVRVDADVLFAAVRENEHEVRRLPPDPRQRQQFVHRRGYAAAEAFQDLAARLLHVHRLGAIEADRVDQLPDPRVRQLRHRPGRARDAEQPRGGGGRDGVLRLRRQHRRDEDLEGIFLLILRDLLDGRLVEAVDRLREPSHDDGDGRGTRHHVIGVRGGWPASTAMTLRTASSIIPRRVSRVALPRCGAMTTFW